MLLAGAVCCGYFDQHLQVDVGLGRSVNDGAWQSSLPYFFFPFFLFRFLLAAAPAAGACDDGAEVDACSRAGGVVRSDDTFLSGSAGLDTAGCCGCRGWGCCWLLPTDDFEAGPGDDAACEGDSVIKVPSLRSSVVIAPSTSMQQALDWLLLLSKGLAATLPLKAFCLVA